MAVGKPEVHWISVMEQDICEIPMATPTFSTTPDSLVTSVTSSEVRRLPYFKMTDSGPEVNIFGGNLEYLIEDGFGES